MTIDVPWIWRVSWRTFVKLRRTPSFSFTHARTTPRAVTPATSSGRRLLTSLRKEICSHFLTLPIKASPQVTLMMTRGASDISSTGAWSCSAHSPSLKTLVFTTNVSVTSLSS
uniref:Uncharacterized protein n=1 Tax=Timema cristinae TaxID=61476 RepID=A0A7R9DPQ4_TIMCR|nr:unnamed protein product [Timema cristinae]